MKQREVTVLPEALRQWRHVRGASQYELARQAGDGVSESLIAAIETGKRQASLNAATSIAAALEVPLTALAIVHTDRFETDGVTPSDDSLISMAQVIGAA